MVVNRACSCTISFYPIGCSRAINILSEHPRSQAADSDEQLHSALSPRISPTEVDLLWKLPACLQVATTSMDIQCGQQSKFDLTVDSDRQTRDRVALPPGQRHIDIESMASATVKPALQTIKSLADKIGKLRLELGSLDAQALNRDPELADEDMALRLLA
jgi:hypothetical protein